MFNKPKYGLSLVELIITMALASILILTTAALLVGSHKAYKQVYESIHDPIQLDSKALTAAFSAVARKANRSNYTVYESINGVYTPAEPDYGKSTASGQAVEFRYWDRPFYELSQDMEQMDVADTGTQYALFYLSDDKLYVDYGDVVDGVGAIRNGVRRTDNVTTQCLVRQVDVDQNTDIFTHEIIGGVGNGCVTLNVTIVNDKDQTVDVKMASLSRVMWPQ